MSAPAPTVRPVFDHSDPAALTFPVGLGTAGDPAQLDLRAAAHTLILGRAGTGKTAVACDLASQWLDRGGELVVATTAHRAADYAWCKGAVRPGGWGCAGTQAAADALGEVLAEGVRRAALLKEHGATWRDLPAEHALAPILVVVDEYATLSEPNVIPKIGPGATPALVALADEAEEVNRAATRVRKAVKRVANELRFVGVHLVVVTQQLVAGDPVLTGNLGHRILMGAKTTEIDRAVAFWDRSGVPAVPAPARGAGTFQSSDGTAGAFVASFAVPAEA